MNKLLARCLHVQLAHNVRESPDTIVSEESPVWVFDEYAFHVSGTGRVRTKIISGVPRSVAR
jgi:hypothetical protein